MTHEERARSLYLEGETTPQTERGIAIIAQAIREAENEVLERAAQHFAEMYGVNGFVTEIRSLKHKGDQ